MCPNALVSFALFGAYVSRAGIKTVDVLHFKVFIRLIQGAMKMKSVWSASLKMVKEVGRQFNTIFPALSLLLFTIVYLMVL